MKDHILKTHRKFFNPMFYGQKTADCRLNDRDFRVGDKITFCEYMPDEDVPLTGRYIHAIITHILFDSDGPWLSSNMCMLSFRKTQQ